jgi:hypothetical protein
MLLGALAGTEMALADLGIPIELGSGVAAAQAHYAVAKQATHVFPRRAVGA